MLRLLLLVSLVLAAPLAAAQDLASVTEEFEAVAGESAMLLMEMAMNPPSVEADEEGTPEVESLGDQMATTSEVAELAYWMAAAIDGCNGEKRDAARKSFEREEFKAFRRAQDFDTAAAEGGPLAPYYERAAELERRLEAALIAAAQAAKAED